MTEPWNVMLIPDAGPLLTLAHADQLDLLFKPGWTVVVVDTVLHEIIRSRSPVSEKLARWVSQSNVPLYQTKVFAKAQSSGIGIGEYQLPKLSDLGLQEAMAELALDSAGMMGLFLLDDHRMVSPPFLVPSNSKKVSTQAYLVYLEQRRHIESAIAVQKAAAIGRRTGTITHPESIASAQPFIEVPITRQGQLGSAVSKPIDSLPKSSHTKQAAAPHHQESNKANKNNKTNNADDTTTLKLGPLAAHPHLIEKALRSSAVAQAERVAMATEFAQKNKVSSEVKKPVIKSAEKAAQEPQQHSEVLGQTTPAALDSSRNGNETQRINSVLQKDPSSVNALVSALTGKAPLVEKPYLNNRKRNSKMIKAKAKAEAKAKQKTDIIQAEPVVQPTPVARKAAKVKSTQAKSTQTKDIGIKEAAVKEAVKAAAANAARAVEEALKEQAKAKAEVNLSKKTQSQGMLTTGLGKPPKPTEHKTKEHKTSVKPDDASGALSLEKTKASRSNKPMAAPMPVAFAPSLLPKLHTELQAESKVSEPTQPNIKAPEPEAPDPTLVNAFAGLIGKKP